MKLSEGPLTDRQIRILDHVREGRRYQYISTRMGITLSTVKHEISNITGKMGEQNFPAALAKYMEATAFRQAAAQVRSGRVSNPLDEVEEHVNHVLEGIAVLFEDWANQRMPK